MKRHFLLLLILSIFLPPCMGSHLVLTGSLDTEDWIIKNGDDRANNLGCLEKRIKHNKSLKTRFSILSKYVAQFYYEKAREYAHMDSLDPTNESPELVTLFESIVRALDDIEFHFDPVILKKEFFIKYDIDTPWTLTHRDVNKYWTGKKWKLAMADVCQDAMIQPSCANRTQAMLLMNYFDVPQFKTEKINGNEFHMNQKRSYLLAVMYKFRLLAMIEEAAILQSYRSNMTRVLDEIWDQPGCYDPFYFHVSLVEAVFAFQHLEKQDLYEDASITKILECREEQEWIGILCNRLSYGEFRALESMPPIAARAFLYLDSDHEIISELCLPDYVSIFKGMRIISAKAIRKSIDRFVRKNAPFSANTKDGFSCHDFDLALCNLNDSLSDKVNTFVQQLRPLMPVLDCGSMTYADLFIVDSFPLAANRQRVMFLLHCRHKAPQIYRAMTERNITFMTYGYDILYEDYDKYPWHRFADELVDYLRSAGILPRSVVTTSLPNNHSSPLSLASSKTIPRQSDKEQKMVKTSRSNVMIPTKFIFNK